MYHLYCISAANDERECVVISSLPRDVIEREYCDGGRQLDKVLPIDGDAGCFPCERELTVKIPCSVCT